MAPVGAEALIEALDLIEKGEAKPEKQDDNLTCYASMITKDMGHIDWNKTSEEIKNKVRGFNPFPAAFTEYNDEVLKIFNVDILDCCNNGRCGEIISIDKKKGFVVKTGNGAVMVTEVQAKGSKKMNCADYMRGHQIEEGKILK